jgi:superfamily II DNA/RNA helicase
LTILPLSGFFAAAPLRPFPDRTLMPFADLGLSDPLLRAIADSGYDEPTPIQKGTISPVLMGKDIIGIAQTGTGKTAAFVLPMISSRLANWPRRSPRISRNMANITSSRWRC